MKGVLLKLYLVSIILLLFSLAVQAQGFRFIYIQTENRKPFYSKMGIEGIRSSPSGYIIIPRLTEGSYKITIGFPQSTLSEFSVIIDLNETDAGYLLKNDVDEGWYMVDLFTLKPLSIERSLTSVKKWEMIKSKDEFARILSEVVNDSTINEIEIFKKTEEIPVKITESKVLNTQIQVQHEALIDNKTAISKLGQKITDEGLSVRYIDKADTVDIFMPVDKPKMLPVIEQNNVSPSSAKLKSVDSIAKSKTSTVLANSKCKKTATQNNFLALRIRMAAAKTATDMQKVARRKFASVCFSTSQVKNLGVLFITEEERYKFYVSAYPYISDVANFTTLQNQLTDSYYINRFKAMLNH